MQRPSSAPEAGGPHESQLSNLDVLHGFLLSTFQHSQPQAGGLQPFSPLATAGSGAPDLHALLTSPLHGPGNSPFKQLGTARAQGLSGWPPLSPLSCLDTATLRPLGGHNVADLMGPSMLLDNSGWDDMRALDTPMKQVLMPDALYSPSPHRSRMVATADVCTMLGLARLPGSFGDAGVRDASTAGGPGGDDTGYHDPGAGLGVHGAPSASTPPVTRHHTPGFEAAAAGHGDAGHSVLSGAMNHGAPDQGGVMLGTAPRTSSRPTSARRASDVASGPHHVSPTTAVTMSRVTGHPVRGTPPGNASLPPLATSTHLARTSSDASPGLGDGAPHTGGNPQNTRGHAGGARAVVVRAVGQPSPSLASDSETSHMSTLPAGGPTGTRAAAAAARAERAARLSTRNSVKVEDSEGNGPTGARLDSARNGTTPVPGSGSGGDGEGSAPPPSSQLQAGPREPAPRSCHCKKSQCLKLYCDCFAAGAFCVACSCSDCYNRPDHMDLVTAKREHIMQRDPKAFQRKILRDESSGGGERHKKGCNCKRSHCLKKYCECYQGGVKCSGSCKCLDCRNMEETTVLSKGAGHAAVPRPARTQRAAAVAAAAQLAASVRESEGGPGAMDELVAPRARNPTPAPLPTSATATITAGGRTAAHAKQPAVVSSAQPAHGSHAFVPAEGSAAPPTHLELPRDALLPTTTTTTTLGLPGSDTATQQFSASCMLTPPPAMPGKAAIARELGGGAGAPDTADTLLHAGLLSTPATLAYPHSLTGGSTGGQYTSVFPWLCGSQGEDFLSSLAAHHPLAAALHALHSPGQTAGMSGDGTDDLLQGALAARKAAWALAAQGMSGSSSATGALQEVLAGLGRPRGSDRPPAAHVLCSPGGSAAGNTTHTTQHPGARVSPDPAHGHQPHTGAVQGGSGSDSDPRTSAGVTVGPGVGRNDPPGGLMGYGLDGMVVDEEALLHAADEELGPEEDDVCMGAGDMPGLTGFSPGHPALDGSCGSASAAQQHAVTLSLAHHLAAAQQLVLSSPALSSGRGSGGLLGTGGEAFGGLSSGGGSTPAQRAALAAAAMARGSPWAAALAGNPMALASLAQALSSPSHGAASGGTGGVHEEASGEQAHSGPPEMGGVHALVSPVRTSRAPRTSTTAGGVGVKRPHAASTGGTAPASEAPRSARGPLLAARTGPLSPRLDALACVAAAASGEVQMHISAGGGVRISGDAAHTGQPSDAQPLATQVQVLLRARAAMSPRKRMAYGSGAAPSRVPVGIVGHHTGGSAQGGVYNDAHPAPQRLPPLRSHASVTSGAPSIPGLTSTQPQQPQAPGVQAAGGTAAGLTGLDARKAQASDYIHSRCRAAQGAGVPRGPSPAALGAPPAAGLISLKSETSSLSLAALPGTGPGLQPRASHGGSEGGAPVRAVTRTPTPAPPPATLLAPQPTTDTKQGGDQDDRLTAAPSLSVPEACGAAAPLPPARAAQPSPPPAAQLAGSCTTPWSASLEAMDGGSLLGGSGLLGDATCLLSPLAGWDTCSLLLSPRVTTPLYAKGGQGSLNSPFFAMGSPPGTARWWSSALLATGAQAQQGGPPQHPAPPAAASLPAQGLLQLAAGAGGEAARGLTPPSHQQVPGLLGLAGLPSTLLRFTSGTTLVSPPLQATSQPAAGGGGAAGGGPSAVNHPPGVA